jgi:hypothetical protein
VAWLEPAVRGVGGQPLATDPGWRFELVIGLNAASPPLAAGPLRRVERHAGRLAVRWVRADVPGQVAATDAAVRAASGEVLALPDDDDAWHPH